jgi:hypothetical protein
MKTKKKGCKMHKAVINKNGNRYMAEGEDEHGNKMFTAIGKADAEEHIKAGTAKKGKGF